MIRYVLHLIIILCLSISVEGQFQEATTSTKRKKIEVPNYTLFLHLHDMALEYSTKLDYKIDSLFNEQNMSFEKNLFDFRIRGLQSLQHVIYKSDPVIAFIDGWIYGVQMVDYLGTEDAREYLGFGHTTMLNLYKKFLLEFTQSYVFLTGNSAENMSARVTQFAKKHPILDHHLNRTTITDATAQWVGEATIGFKSGVATLTDAVRNISDRLNYHSEFTPKIVEWNVQRSIGNIVGTDSLGPILVNGISSLDRITNRVDSIDHLIYSVTDTVLTDVNRQRRETLGFFSSERKAVLEQISVEREILFEKMVEERLAVERLFTQEREASLDHFESLMKDTTEYSFDRVDATIDRLFFRVLILITILAVGLVLAVVVYKKM